MKALPPVATLYVAGPRAARVWVNGALVAEMKYAGGHHMGFGTMSADVGGALRVGANVIAVEAVRGLGSHHHTNALKTSWLNSGEVLVVKIVDASSETHPSFARVGHPGSSLVITDGAWKSVVGAERGWEQAGFDDSRWKRVVNLGGIESSIDFFQWNADAGMYDWPGYWGEAPYMANYLLEPESSKKVEGGTLLDFGRELNGRLVVTGGAADVRMGESMGELMKAPYLGEIALRAPVGGEARGPKTGFRYALVSSEQNVKVVAEGIYYPATQVGTFESNDARVNKIFETAVYTAHLSMQDSILDGIKRDRGRWIGDDEVINRVALDVYGNVPQIREGLEDAIGPAPVTEAVNGLPGYSAWWVVAEWEYVVRTGDLEQLRGVTARMLQLLEVMRKDLDERNVYAGKGKPFVDWSKGFSTDTPEARKGVHFEYLYAFHKAEELFAMMHDDANCGRYKALAEAMTQAATTNLADQDGMFGDRWQTNAMACLADAVWPLKTPPSGPLWPIFGKANAERRPYDVITPYYGSYLLKAMSEVGHESDALAWMKSYWGGMLDNGATSFWEAWDPAWAGSDPHAKLEADDKVGYNASLSHGWSSGPAAWLLEDVLGIRATEPGYKKVSIEPTLAGLEWVKGSIATPLGLVRVEAGGKKISVELPAGMSGELRMPGVGWSGRVVIGLGIKDAAGTSSAELKGPGHYDFVRN